MYRVQIWMSSRWHVKYLAADTNANNKLRSMDVRRELKTTEAERERKRQYYQQNKAALKARTAQWKRDNPDKVRMHTAAYRKRYEIELRVRAAIYYSRNSRDALRRQRERYAVAKTLTCSRISMERPSASTSSVDAQMDGLPKRFRLDIHRATILVSLLHLNFAAYRPK
jgi:hypothetical protein